MENDQRDGAVISSGVFGAFSFLHFLMFLHLFFALAGSLTPRATLAHAILLPTGSNMAPGGAQGAPGGPRGPQGPRGLGP